MGILDFWLLRCKSLQKRILLLTGPPGIGKTTVLTRTAEALKEKGYRVGGMISREAREDNVRVGFEIIDLTNGKHGWLARIDQKAGPQVGKYGVNLSDLENIGATAISEAAEECVAVAVDEVGPMELFSQKFKTAVRQALDSKKLVLAVIHAKAQNPLISYAKQREDAVLYTLNLGNRQIMPETFSEAALTYLNAQQVT